MWGFDISDFLKRKPSFCPNAFHVRLGRIKWQWDRSFSEYLGLSLSLIIPPILHILLSFGDEQWTQ